MIANRQLFPPRKRLPPILNQPVSKECRQGFPKGTVLTGLLYLEDVKSVKLTLSYGRLFLFTWSATSARLPTTLHTAIMARENALLSH